MKTAIPASMALRFACTKFTGCRRGDGTEIRLANPTLGRIMRSSQGLPQAARRGSLDGFAHVTGTQLLLSRRGRLLGATPPLPKWSRAASVTLCASCRSIQFTGVHQHPFAPEFRADGFIAVQQRPSWFIAVAAVAAAVRTLIRGGPHRWPDARSATWTSHLRPCSAPVSKCVHDSAPSPPALASRHARSSGRASRSLARSARSLARMMSSRAAALIVNPLP